MRVSYKFQDLNEEFETNTKDGVPSKEKTLRETVQWGVKPCSKFTNEISIFKGGGG